MHFDDRLATVLKQPVRGQEIARVQYVQLLDLLGKSAAGSGSAILGGGYERLAELSRLLPAAKRGELLKATGLKLRNPELVALLAQDDTAVSIPAIASADLDEAQWLDLIPALPVQARGIMRLRRDLGSAVDARLERLGIVDRGLPPANLPDAQIVALTPRAPPRPEPAEETGIGAIVRRIEAFRKERSVPETQGQLNAPRLPLGDQEHRGRGTVEKFDFTLDASGVVTDADGSVAPMVVGMSLATLPSRAVSVNALSAAQAMRMRQPVEAQIATIEAAPAISGEWQIDAAPRFDIANGHLTGYAGRARRLTVEVDESAAKLRGSDRMRQVLHELRNPAGAIQMSSELIQQQVVGEVSHEYRSIAATIASDTALVLAGFDELDRLVKLDSNATALEPGESDFVELVATLAEHINRHASQRESGFEMESAEDEIQVPVWHADLERLVWRLLAAVGGAAGPGEKLKLVLDRDEQHANLRIGLPVALRSLTDDDLFYAQAKERGPALSAGMFGLGFTLRLARAEAKSANGSLAREDGVLRLSLPLCAAPSALVSGA